MAMFSKHFLNTHKRATPSVDNDVGTAVRAEDDLLISDKINVMNNKPAPISIDNMDNQLIDLLRANARESTSSLARKLSLSRSTVQSRMLNLERKKVIAGYTVRYHEQLKKLQITAHVSIRVYTMQSSQVANQLEKLREVRCLYAISGEYDLIAMVEAATTEEVDSALDRIGRLPNIEKMASSIVLSTKFDR